MTKEEELAWEDAHKYFTAVEFMCLFRDNPKEMMDIIQREFPSDTRNLKIYLQGKTPGPVARLLQEYKVDE